jgi:putative transposase
LHPHAICRSLDPDASTRQAAYRSLVDQVLPDSEINDVRRHVQQQHALGSPRFRAAIEAQLGRRAGPATIGRPPKQLA